jgi:hypothetical protein
MSGDQPWSSKPRLGRFIVPSSSFLSVFVAREAGSFGFSGPDRGRFAVAFAPGPGSFAAACAFAFDGSTTPG